MINDSRPILGQLRLKEPESLTKKFKVNCCIKFKIYELDELRIEYSHYILDSIV